MNLRSNTGGVSDEAYGTATLSLPYTEGRTSVEPDDLRIVSLPVFTNKRYHIKITTAARVKFVLVVKARTAPDVEDFYGGHLIDREATLLRIDFFEENVTTSKHHHTATGLEYVVIDSNNVTVNLFGTVRGSEDYITLYLGVMPQVHDRLLCEQCMGETNVASRCGFCPGEAGESNRTGSDENISGNVNVTLLLFMAECMYWNGEKRAWRKDGCNVGLL